MSLSRVGGFMRKSGILALAALAAGFAAPAPAALTPSDRFASELLAAHNQERASVGVPALAWDPRLAIAAEQYADRLAAIGHLRHSARKTRPGQGENLWMGTRGAFSLRHMMHDWASEKRMFRAGVFPNNSRTRNWSDVGHYTQIIWPGTTRVGCGIAHSRQHDFLVCRYSPAGNVMGQRLL
jgi:Cysteine-rich secretory protein family